MFTRTERSWKVEIPRSADFQAGCIADVRIRKVEFALAHQRFGGFSRIGIRRRRRLGNLRHSLPRRTAARAARRILLTCVKVLGNPELTIGLKLINLIIETKGRRVGKVFRPRVRSRVIAEAFVDGRAAIRVTGSSRLQRGAIPYDEPRWTHDQRRKQRNLTPALPFQRNMQTSPA